MLLIPTDNDAPIRGVTPANLADVVELIGNGSSYVEVVNIPDGTLLIVDEEARCGPELPPINARASAMFGRELLGNAIHLTSEELDGIDP